MNITEAELIEALATASSAPEDARTVQEMVRATGYSEVKIRAGLRLLHVEGRLQPHRVRRVGIDGRNALVSAYTILPAPKPAKPAKRRG